jgi:hypothetical protein
MTLKTPFTGLEWGLTSHDQKTKEDPNSETSEIEFIRSVDKLFRFNSLNQMDIIFEYNELKGTCNLISALEKYHIQQYHRVRSESSFYTCGPCGPPGRRAP